MMPGFHSQVWSDAAIAIRHYHSMADPPLLRSCLSLWLTFIAQQPA
jgi:hypothetical protein